MFTETEKIAGMSTNKWIAVPTYWTYPSDAPGEERFAFDHPTPLDENGTIQRMLDSFLSLEGRFRVLIVLGVTNPELNQRAHDKVTSLLVPYTDRLSIYLVSAVNLDTINNQLSDPILDLVGYGNIRNVQLAVPYILGADVVIGIDDDEIVDDPRYLEYVDRYAGAEVDGVPVGGMAGPYFDRSGEYRIGGAEDLGALKNVFLKKNYFMNEALKKFMAEAGATGIVKSNVAFGGNMCMFRDTIAKACHDPYIPRGEDYDYVINAKMEGVTFFFQPAMSVVHLPPDSTGSQAGDKLSKLISDIRRFTYMQVKMAYHARHFPEEQFDRDYLMPYPGPYAEETLDLPAHGVEALDEGYPEFRREGGSPEAVVDEAVATAQAKVKEFFDYRRQWKTALAEMDANPELMSAAERFRV